MHRPEPRWEGDRKRPGLLAAMLQWPAEGVPDRPRLEPPLERAGNTAAARESYLQAARTTASTPEHPFGSSMGGHERGQPGPVNGRGLCQVDQDRDSDPQCFRQRSTKGRDRRSVDGAADDDHGPPFTA